MSTAFAPSHSDTISIDLSHFQFPDASSKHEPLRFREITSAMVAFVDRAPHNSRYLTPEGERYMIVEEQLNISGMVSHKLVSRYQNSPIEISIVLHKNKLIAPLLVVMSEIERHPDVFMRSQLLVMPQIAQDPLLKGWIDAAPSQRESRIQIAGQPKPPFTQNLRTPTF